MVDPALVEDIVIGKSDYPYPLLTPFIVILQEHVILPPLATKLEQRH